MRAAGGGPWLADPRTKADGQTGEYECAEGSREVRRGFGVCAGVDLCGEACGGSSGEAGRGVSVSVSMSISMSMSKRRACEMPRRAGGLSSDGRLGTVFGSTRQRQMQARRVRWSGYASC
jgi:hypothetical protein